jgi:hypothetical protein
VAQWIVDMCHNEDGLWHSKRIVDTCHEDGLWHSEWIFTRVMKTDCGTLDCLQCPNEDGLWHSEQTVYTCRNDELWLSEWIAYTWHNENVLWHSK